MRTQRLVVCILMWLLARAWLEARAGLGLWPADVHYVVGGIQDGGWHASRKPVRETMQVRVQASKSALL